MPTETVPDPTGHFGPYGGRFVPEALVAAIDDLTAAFHETQADPAFRAELAAPASRLQPAGRRR